MMPRAQFCEHLMSVAGRGDHIADADFTDCCYRAVSEHGYNPAHLNQTMEIGPASFERWIAGANLPHPMIRGKILLAIAHHLKAA